MAADFFALTEFFNNPKKLNVKAISIIQKAGRSVACDSINSKVFFASNDGVYEYSAKTLKPIEFRKERISASKLYLLNNVLWIATFNNGFITYDGKSTKSEDNINRLIKGKQINTFKIKNGIVWIATERCLNKINIKNETAEYYDLSDGLMSRQINDIAFMNDNVYLATNTGIIHFKGNTPSINKTPPQIAITLVSIGNQSVNLVFKKEIDYSNNKIGFHFISPCFRARGKFHYKYRLDGLDTNWTIVPAVNNEVIYASLPAGDFTFEVKAINEDGVESLKAETFLFTIKKPFWQEIWFYVVVAASGALLVYLISLSVIKNIRRKAEIKNDLISSKLTAIRAQMNPHFMYNTLNSIQDLILQSDIKNTNYYLSKFSSLMRKILEFSEKEKVFLDEEVEMLNYYLELEKLRFGDKFKYAINFEKEVETTRLLVPPMIIQPFIENAIKHGLLHNKGDQKLDIKFRLDYSVLICEITDNGVGRKRSEEIKARNSKNHPSFATQAIDKHMYLLNSVKGKKYSLQIIDLYEAEMAIGTKVIISIPI
ncbi:MAG: histidine kinase [Sphingobacteriaceae bacterium]|nr:histidine kinase [Sphingobacteriaceae bacterium]